MRFTYASLSALVLLSGREFPNGIASVSAFVPPSSEAHAVRYTFDLMATSDTTSSPLPPSLHGSGVNLENGRRNQRKKSPKRRPRSSGKKDWKAPVIPDAIPKLSDLIKDASVQDFSGDISSSLRNGSNDKNGKVEAASPHKKNDRNGNVHQKEREPHSDNYSKATHRPAPNEQQERLEPWRANYQTSTQTQSRIKAAAANMARRPAIERATAVLRTLLQTPPQKCNEANLVCALTLSAKAMMPSTPITPTFRAMLLETLDILSKLVLDERLNARQLCNAVWAVAKHYNRDHTILPPPPETTAMSTEDMVGVAEAWILQAESDDTVEQRVKETLDAIATQLTSILQNEDKNAPKKPKVGELCMASWAYGVLRPRCRPPGWAVPPQMGRIPKAQASKPRNVEFVTFEQWANVQEDDNGVGSPADSIDRLFDAVGDALCQKDASVDGELVEGPPLLESCTWSEIANVAWAYASHGYCQTPSSEAAMRGLAHEATHRLRQSEQTVLPRDVAQLVWAIGTLQSDNFRLADDLQELIHAIASHWNIGESTTGNDRPLRQWSCPDLVQLAISLAHGRIDHLPVLHTVYEEAHRRLMEDTATPTPRSRIGDGTFVPGKLAYCYGHKLVSTFVNRRVKSLKPLLRKRLHG